IRIACLCLVCDAVIYPDVLSCACGRVISNDPRIVVRDCDCIFEVHDRSVCWLMCYRCHRSLCVPLAYCLEISGSLAVNPFIPKSVWIIVSIPETFLISCIPDASSDAEEITAGLHDLVCA